jgi:hypothetical protein
MFNSGEDDAARAFEKTFRARSALQRRPIEERVRQLRELRQRWPRLAARRVVHAEERALTLLASVEPGDEVFELQFDFERQEPYGLLGILIQGPVDPGAISETSEPLDADTRSATIERIIEILNNGYVFPEIAKQMDAALRGYVAGGRYDNVTNARVFATRLTEDLRAVSSDRHLAVRAGGLPSRVTGEHDPRAEARNNYGFVRVERLAGNVGYLKFNQFHPTEEAQEIAKAALAFLANCDALIFDLRENGGGSPEMIRFISSYLFDQPTHLNSFYDRTSNKTSETWTTKDVPGNRFGEDLPVYVLTSHYTFSGAEEFTYNLKHLKRATIVGETTGGGAHPVKPERVNDQFSVTLPFARAFNPITKTNWEGVGVVPHIETTAEKALDVAHQDALKRVAAARGPEGLASESTNPCRIIQESKTE